MGTHRAEGKLMRIALCLPDQGGGIQEQDTPPPPDWIGTRGLLLVWATALTLLGQPQEQHVAVRAPGPAGGWSHFELVVLAPAEAPELGALRAGQQGLCPRRALASGHRLGPEERRVGLGRGSGAADLGESPDKGGGQRRGAVRTGDRLRPWAPGLTFQLSHTAGPGAVPSAGPGFSRVTFSSWMRTASSSRGSGGRTGLG